MNIKRMKSIADSHISAWASWRIRYDSGSGNPLGYPSSTTEARIADGTAGSQTGRPKSRVPMNAMMQPDVARVERAYEAMPQELREVIWCKYIVPGSETARAKVFTEIAGQSKAQYYKMIDNALMYYAAKII